MIQRNVIFLSLLISSLTIAAERTKPGNNRDTGERISVAGRYNTGAGQAIANNTTPCFVDFSANTDFDTDNAYQKGNSSGTCTWSTSPGYICPIAGKYRVSARILFSSNATPATAYYILTLYKNGTAVSEIGKTVAFANITVTVPVEGTDLIQCNTGDLLQISAYQDTGTSTINLYASGVYNFMAIERVAD